MASLIGIPSLCGEGKRPEGGENHGKESSDDCSGNYSIDCQHGKVGNRK